MVELKSGSRIMKYLILVAVFFLGVLFGGLIFSGGYFFQTKINNQAEKKHEMRQDGGYKFINPLLECEVEDDASMRKYVPFEKNAKEKILTEVVKKNPDIHLSLYFRNLNNGPWFGINEKDVFSPASLLKVPLMMAWLKLAENDQYVLARLVSVGKFRSENVAQNFPSKEQIQEGETYSISELIRRMIVFSDNQAMNVLLENIPAKDLNQIYIDLGINVPDIKEMDDFMSVKDYASFFRILYNSAYLERSFSEKALGILSATDYSKGLISELPKDVTVAHKFGEREFDENGKTIKQLHDCGIVYYEKYPYLICIMTRGDDYEKLAQTIAMSSKIIFEEVRKAFP